MQTLTEKLMEQGLMDRILSERQLARLIGPADASRYGLVNRALKANELIRIRRGLYVLPPRLRTERVHPYVVAQSIVPGSYVSFETALSHHGWIPESVAVTASVVPGRKSTHLEHRALGSFAFHPLALHRVQFLVSVERRLFGRQVALVAKPLRALIDLVALRKHPWRGLDFLTRGMRIDAESLRVATGEDAESLLQVYKHKLANEFLRSLMKELGQ